MNTKFKIVSVLAAALVCLMAVIGFVSAASISAVQEVKVNGDVISEAGTNSVLNIEKDDSFDVKVKVKSIVALDNVQVEAVIRGYDHSDYIEDISDAFDMKANVTYYKTLKLSLPLRMEQDGYRLRVIVSDRNSGEEVKNYEFDISGGRHALEINRVILSPESDIKAGRSLLTSVRVKNRGLKDEEDVVVKVSIPELGISGTDIISEVEGEDKEDDSVTSEEIWMKIPETAATGDYQLRVTVEYDDGDEVVSQTEMIHVEGVETQIVAPAADKSKTKITVGPAVQEIVKGETKTYFVTIENMGSSAQIYTIGVDGAVFADTVVSPSAVDVVEAGATEVFSVAVTPKATAAAGVNAFTVSVKVGDKTEQATLSANVAEPVKSDSTWGKVKRALEIGLVVLVVLLVILGLIIGFNKLKGDDDESEEGGQTYY